MSMSQPAATPDMEFQALVRTQYAGNPHAMTALGARLVVGRDAPLSPVDGAMLIEEAARLGDPAAWPYIAVLAAAGAGRTQSWSDAFDALARAAAGGDAHALFQQRLLRELGVQGAADAEKWVSTTRGEVLREAPRWVVFAGFLTPAVCAYLVDRAAPKLIRAQVNDARGGGLKVDSMRTNTGAPFSLIETDLVMQMIRARIAHAAGVAAAVLEPTEILHYAIGETYKPHFDFFHPSLPNYPEEMRVRGQRAKTALIYLNGGYEGGETDFPRLGVKFRGGVGELLIFDNLSADGNGDTNTLHTGLPPTRGEKWLLSQWIRDKPQRIA